MDALGLIIIIVVKVSTFVAGSTIPPTTSAPMPCICTMEYMPVCGVDGITYGNKCAMDCGGVELDHQGKCRAPCICPFNYAPVCGQDGKTYSNQCAMNCNGVAFFQDGPCNGVNSPNQIQKRAAGFCICTFIYMPVCGSNGVSYGNECNLHCEDGITELHKGPCDGTETLNIVTDKPTTVA